MAKTLIAFFSRADENYFGGSMKYIEVNRADAQIESWLKLNGLM